MMFKLTYWYIRDVCSMVSHVKGYQALPLLTFCRRRVEESLGTRLQPHYHLTHQQSQREQLWPDCLWYLSAPTFTEQNLAIPGKQKHLIWTLSSGSGCTLVQSVNWGQLPLASVAIVWLSSDNSIIQVSFSTRGGKTDHRECWWTPVTVQMIIWLTNMEFHHAQDLQVFAALQDSRHFHSHQKYRNWWVCRKPWLVILVHILEVPKLIYPQKQTRE